MKLQMSGFLLVALLIVGCATQQSVPTATDPTGDWKITANNFKGRLELRESNGTYAGRVWFDVHKRWETLVNLKITGDTIQFRRLAQDYTGTYARGELKGTFTNSAGRTYSWNAIR